MIKCFKNNWTKILIAMSICFMAIFSFAFTCKTYAYSIDNNGNLVGDNLFNSANINDNNLSTQHNIESYISNSSGVIVIASSSDDPYIYFNNIITLTPGRYTYSFNCNVYIQQCGLTTNNSYSFLASTGGMYDSYSFDVSVTTTYGIGFELDSINTTIQFMVNKGDSALPWEPYGVWYSQANYDTLENQLNTTNGLLDLQIDITKYGWLSYIDNFDYYVTGNFVEDFTFNELKSNNYISSNATLDLYQISRYQNPNYSYIKFDIYFQNSYSNVDYFSANLFDLSTKLGFNGVLTIYDTDSNSVVFNITDIMSITYEDIISQNNNFGDYIYNVVFEFASPDASTMIYTNSFYSRGYQTGYSYGSNVSTGYYTPIINDLNGRITNLENDILSLNNTIDTLKELNAQYQQQLADNVGWSSLFFAFADTPFKVVSNVLGFELFGLNLFATFIGMITVFGVVYLLKKFL